MIKLTRPAEPAILRSKAVGQEFNALRRQAMRTEDLPLTFGSYWSDVTVRTALVEAQSAKCAYCESAFGPDNLTLAVEQHRPRQRAIDRDGSVSSRHYWWLANTWSNLLLACVNCSRAKGTRFPVLSHRAAELSDRGTEPDVFDEEGPLLLDPFYDEPDVHLTFDTDRGVVLAQSERGQAAIDVLALNRIDLVEARRARALLIRDTWFRASNEANPDVIRMLEPDQPHLAMARQLISELRETDPEEAGQRFARSLKSRVDAVEASRQDYELAEDSDSMDDEDRRRFYASTIWVERVVMRNFRAIRELDLDLSRSTSETGPWSVLLGENGTGKTSVLQAIALTLMGTEQRRRLVPDAGRTVRRGAKHGSVEVFLAGRTTPLVLRFQRGQTLFDGPGSDRLGLLGYGSTRLPSQRASALYSTHGVKVHADNLFDPLLPLTSPAQWLLSLDDSLFDRVSEWLGQLLPLRSGQRVTRDRHAQSIELRAGRSRSSLDELSDGYQSMIILLCDVMRTLLPLWDNNLEQAEGVVLIDELGTHLHPRWRMRIVSALRGVLPRVQVIATTHDPLCLRGLSDGEAVVLRRRDDKGHHIFALDDLPSVQGLRVEQLLASDYFGLGSTSDPKVDDLYEQYYRLRAKRTLSIAQTDLLASIEQQLMELDQLGNSEQERLVFRAAGDYIANRRAGVESVSHGETMKAEAVRARLADLWSSNLPAWPDEA